MPARLHPGIYVEEVPGSLHAIEAAGTSTAIFVGDTERGPLDPTKIKNRTDYTRTFGGYLRDAGAGGRAALPMAYAMDAFFQNGGGTAYILRAVDAAAATGARTVGNLSLRASSPGAWSLRM